jgi:hypothetical protein
LLGVALRCLGENACDAGFCFLLDRWMLGATLGDRYERRPEVIGPLIGHPMHLVAFQALECHAEARVVKFVDDHHHEQSGSAAAASWQRLVLRGPISAYRAPGHVRLSPFIELPAALAIGYDNEAVPLRLDVHVG